MLAALRPTRFVRVLGLAGLLALPSRPCIAATDALPPDVQAVIREQFGSPDAETRYLDRAIDLNGDGTREIVVHVVGPMACGTGGCPTMVFTPAASGYRLVSTISVTNTPIGVATTTTQGWRNLIVRVRGGGMRARDVELRFDGRSYPSNPTVPGPRVETTTAPQAQVVIAALASFDDAKLLPSGSSPPAAAKPAPSPVAGAASPAPPQASAPSAGSGPSFDCAQAALPVEKLICAERTLAARDRALGAAYTAAMRQWPDDVKTRARAAQRTWLAQRNACAQRSDATACVTASYQRRLIEVQIQGGQLGAATPVAYVCKGHEGTAVSVVFYNETDPPSAAITLGERTAILLAVPAASGARYASDDVELWEHHGEATLTWAGVKWVCQARRAPSARRTDLLVPQLRLRHAERAADQRMIGDPAGVENLGLEQADAAGALQEVRDLGAGGRGAQVRRVDLLLLAQHARGERLRVGHPGLVQSADDAGEQDRSGPIQDRPENLTEPAVRERDAVVERLPPQPFGDVEDAEAHVAALVAGDELDDAAEQGMGRVRAERLEDAHREALEIELLGRDQLERIVHREERVEHHLGAEIDVLDLFTHQIEEATVRQMMARLVHRLRRGVVPIVFLVQDEDEARAHVLRDALADLQDVEHAADGAARGVGPHGLGERLEGRRLTVGGPTVGHERIVGRDRHAPVDVLLEVPVRRVGFGEQRVDAGMTGVLELQEVARSHGQVLSTAPIGWR